MCAVCRIKAFNQTADSFKRLSKSITDYTSFVLEYALGWQNCMPAFTTIINNIYLLLIPVGILIGMHTMDFREYYFRQQTESTHQADGPFRIMTVLAAHYRLSGAHLCTLITR